MEEQLSQSNLETEATENTINEILQKRVSIRVRQEAFPLIKEIMQTHNLTPEQAADRLVEVWEKGPESDPQHYFQKVQEIPGQGYVVVG